MQILSASQTRDLDRHTIEHKGMASVDLMEQASRVFTQWFVEEEPDEDRNIWVFCGLGNNGGDGLAVARMLHQNFYKVKVWLCAPDGATVSEDNAANQARWKALRTKPVQYISRVSDFPEIPKDVYVIDALFGSGLSRPLDGFWKDIVEKINLSGVKVFSIDIPSGLFADQHTEGPSIQAYKTFSFEFPKLAFFMSENQNRVGTWHFSSIGLDEDFAWSLPTPNHLLLHEDVESLIHNRHTFDHKGTFGHALLVMGSYGKIGAAILGARAALHSGCGLVTVHVPKCGYEIMQISFPEAMVSVDRHQFCFTESPNLHGFKAIGIGCGLGTSQLTNLALGELLLQVQSPVVLDADALNIIGAMPDWLSRIPHQSILTPHPKEFERLFGKTEHDFERLQLQREKAMEWNVFVILKGAFTSIACPDGTVFFNSTGNPGMATAGSGDVLTGILTGLLAQGYSSKDTCILGVYLHGLAGDLALADQSEEGLIASDIIAQLGPAFQVLKGKSLNPEF